MGMTSNAPRTPCERMVPLERPPNALLFSGGNNDAGRP